MTKQIYLLFFFLLSLTNPVFAEPQTITLKDGSQIKGELVGVGNGVYTVHTTTMGDVKLNISQVASITNGTPAAPQQQVYSQPTDNGLGSKIQSAQTKLMSDPNMMLQLQDLMQDPELMKLLSDPELVHAVTSRDVKAIEANPKAQQLINNPKMRALMDEMHGKGY